MNSEKNYCGTASRKASAKWRFARWLEYSIDIAY